MGETHVQYIPNVTVQSGITTYPRYIGEVLPHPFIQNTLLTILAVWDRDEIWGNESKMNPFDYGSESNPVTNAWNTPPPRRDESSKYPIYYCRVNDTNEQWIVFRWILLDENRPTDLLGYSNTQVADGNQLLPLPVIPPNKPQPIRSEGQSFSPLPFSFNSATYTVTNRDLDALAVINAINATGVTLTTPQEDAIDNRIIAAKADGVWTKWIAYYGFIGGTAASHAINWKNPSSYLMTWNGTITHNASGVKSTSGGYGNTGINPSTTLTYTGIGLGYYLTEVKASEGSYDAGVLAGGNSCTITIFNGVGLFEQGTLYLGSTSNDRSKQYYSGNKVGTTATAYKNGVSVDSGSAGSGTLPNGNIYILRLNYSTAYASTARMGSFTINSGLTDSEETANYISELAFQTASGRN